MRCGFCRGCLYVTDDHEGGLDAPTLCLACESNASNDRDGLCGFCRADGCIGREVAKPALTPEQRARLAKIGAERRASIERDQEAKETTQ